jgi:hypothetical protein
MALDTVADYIHDARVLLQDEVTPYRYSDAQMVTALNYAFMEVRRIRPDVVKSFFNSSLPTYSTASPSTTVALDPQYRVAFLYYICGMTQLRDDEATQDARASGFMNKFTSSLLAAGG